MSSAMTQTSPPAHSKPTSLRAAAPALIALCLTMLVEMVDNSVLNVALPTIGRDLDAGPTGLQWMVSAYSLTFGGLLMVGGTLGDRLGRRRALLWGLTGFGASSLLVLLVDSTPGLIALRALMGAFAALITPGTMSLVFRLFDDTALRSRAIGLIVSVSMVGFAVGPVLSGLAVEHWPWQALLFVNAPVALVAWLGVRLGIPSDDPADRRTGATDLPGGVFSVTTLGLGLYALTLVVEDGWTSPTTLAVISGAALAAVAFVLRERRATDPMLDLRLLARPEVHGSALLQTAVTVAMVGVVFASTQLFQYAWHWSPVQSGLGSLPMVVGMFAAAPLTDRVVEARGHRQTCVVGIGFVLAALLVMFLGLSHGYAAFAAGLFLMAIGMRLVMTTCAIALIDALPEDHTSIGSALNDTAQEVGNALGVAVIGTVMAAVMGSALPQASWSPTVVGEFLHSQHIALGLLAGVVLVFAVIGVRTLTDSRSTEEA